MVLLFTLTSCTPNIELAHKCTFSPPKKTRWVSMDKMNWWSFPSARQTVLSAYWTTSTRKAAVSLPLSLCVYIYTLVCLATEAKPDSSVVRLHFMQVTFQVWNSCSAKPFWIWYLRSRQNILIFRTSSKIHWHGAVLSNLGCTLESFRSLKTPKPQCLESLRLGPRHQDFKNSSQVMNHYHRQVNRLSAWTSLCGCFLCWAFSFSSVFCLCPCTGRTTPFLVANPPVAVVFPGGHYKAKQIHSTAVCIALNWFLWANSWLSRWPLLIQCPQHLHVKLWGGAMPCSPGGRTLGAMTWYHAPALGSLSVRTLCVCDR